MRTIKLIIIGLLINQVTNAQIVAFNSFNSSVGSPDKDSPVKVSNFKGKTYVFGNTNSTLTNQFVPAVFGGGDVFVAKYDSAGAFIETKIFGGDQSDKLVKVLEDNYGFWLYILSKSGISGNRTISQQCASSIDPAGCDIYILRLNKSLIKTGEYSSCVGIGRHSDIANGSIIDLFDVILSPSKRLEYVYQEKSSTTGLHGLSYVVGDTTGGITRSYNIFSVSSWFPYTNQQKLRANKIMYINDSTSYVVGTTVIPDHLNNTYRGIAGLYQVKTNRPYSTFPLKTFYSQKSESNAKTAIFNNGKLHVFVDDQPLSTNSFTNATYFGSNGVPRTAPAKALANKSDVWGIVLDSITLNVKAQYAIGNPGNTVGITTKLYDGSILLACNTDGGIGIDKTSANKGGYDYWLVRLDSSLNTVQTQISKGGSMDDLLTDLYFENGVLLMTGLSKSGTSFDKDSPTYDGGVYGDAWTVAMCNRPTADFIVSSNVINSGDLVSFTNKSKNAFTYGWDFGDSTNVTGISFYTEVNPNHYYYNQGYKSVMLWAWNIVNCWTFKNAQNVIFVGGTTVGLDELKNNGISITPNPFLNSVSLKSMQEIKSAVIYDIQGKEVLNEQVVGFDNTINTESIIPGAYIIRLTTTNNEIINQKIIKQ